MYKRNVDGDSATDVDLSIDRVHNVVLRRVRLDPVNNATRRLVLDRDRGLGVRAAFAHLRELKDLARSELDFACP